MHHWADIPAWVGVTAPLAAEVTVDGAERNPLLRSRMWGNRTAIKVWDQREFRNLDDTVDLGVRNIKVALRRLRRFARKGAATELDLDSTIAGIKQYIQPYTIKDFGTTTRTRKKIAISEIHKNIKPKRFEF